MYCLTGAHEVAELVLTVHLAPSWVENFVYLC